MIVLVIFAGVNSNTQELPSTHQYCVSHLDFWHCPLGPDAAFPTLCSSKGRIEGEDAVGNCIFGPMSMFLMYSKSRKSADSKNNRVKLFLSNTRKREDERNN